jgi:hypothetical protein
MNDLLSGVVRYIEIETYLQKPIMTPRGPNTITAY